MEIVLDAASAGVLRQLDGALVQSQRAAQGAADMATKLAAQVLERKAERDQYIKQFCILSDVPPEDQDPDKWTIDAASGKITKK